MNEIRRSVYLQAMGVDAYVSRGQLPGAAETRRLAIVRAAPAALAPSVAARPTADIGRARPSAPPIAVPRIEMARTTPAPAVAAAPPGPESVPPRFSLAAVTCGGWLWLEELEGAPLAAEQLQLLQAMADALAMIARNDAGDRGDRGPARAVSTRFDWPIHTNQQLDLGEDAARASLAAFIQRKLEQPDCNGLILLGRACEARVPLAQLACPRLACTASTAEMLRNPLLKKQAWRDLRPLFESA